jgi:hypothetical protein
MTSEAQTKTITPPPKEKFFGSFLQKGTKTPSKLTKKELN